MSELEDNIDEHMEFSTAKDLAPASSAQPPDPFHFKILCPLSITGLIIGRGGTIINQLNNTCGAKIRLSQNHEYFPGTQDRVLLLKGDRAGIANALRELVTRIAEAPEKKNSPSYDHLGNPIPQPNRGPQGTYQIKVLIPKMASASIIGKGGAVIKRMTEVSGARYQLGDEADPFNTKERVVTISSLSVNNLVAGAQTLMNQLFDDPRVRAYTNITTNYSGVNNNGGGGGFVARPQMHFPLAQGNHLQPPPGMAMMHPSLQGQMFPTPSMMPAQMVMQNGSGPGYMPPPPMSAPGPFPFNENMNIFHHNAQYPSQMQVPMASASPHGPPLNPAGQMPPQYGFVPMPNPAQQFPVPGPTSGNHMYGHFGPAPLQQLPMQHEQIYGNMMRPHMPPASNAPPSSSPQMFVSPNNRQQQVPLHQRQQQTPSHSPPPGTMYSPGGPMPLNK